jgi:hypothetical protein
MGRPKKCDYHPNPFLTYTDATSTTSTTTTPPPLDLSSYINIPSSGNSCPTTTSTTTTTTSTTLPPFDPQYPCASYSFLPSDTNGAVVTFAPCDNDNSVNQVVIGVVQRLDFCVERSAPVSILSGNGRLVYNGGCDRFVNVVETTTTTTTTTTLGPISEKLASPIIIENIEYLSEPLPFFVNKETCEQTPYSYNVDYRKRLIISIDPPQQWLNLINNGRTIYIKMLYCNIIDSYFTEDCQDLGAIIYFNQNYRSRQEVIYRFLDYSILPPLYYNDIYYTRFGYTCDQISTYQFRYKFQAYMLDNTYSPSNIVESNTYTSA